METIIELFEKSVEQYPNNPFLWEKSERAYTSQSYKELHTEVQLLAAGLYAMGTKKVIELDYFLKEEMLGYFQN